MKNIEEIDILYETKLWDNRIHCIVTLDMSKTHCSKSRTWQLAPIKFEVTILWHSNANVSPKLTKSQDYENF